MFRIGQDVICVKELWPTAHGERLPEIGKTYTVRDIVLVSDQSRIYLYEIQNPEFKYEEGFMEPCFHVGGFRHVHTTDIAIFRKILNSAPTYRVEA